MIARTILMAALAAIASAATGAALAQSFTQAAPGKQLFDAQCVDCHGINGTGDEAPAINHTLSADDAALHKIIRDGTPDGRMPRVRRMTEEEVDQLVAYVRVLGRGASTPVVGNADRGRGIYQRLDCRTCHVIGGQGGVLGPDLTRVGQRRAVNYLRQAVLEPGKVKPKGSTNILLNGFSEYLPVSVVERNGREVRGIRVNEDSFTIQVRDTAGTLYSFRKTDVQNVDKQFGRSLMPGYKDKLSTGETDDLVAYLASLGAAK
jgi:putative heme-binding domain-containing protein